MNDATKERLRRFLPYLAYPLFYIFCLLVFLVWTFPMEMLKDRLVTSFNAQQRGTSSPQELSIESLDSWWITGVKATGVKLTAPSSDPAKPTTEVKVDEVRARFSVLPLFIGNKDVTFSADAFGGTASGSFEDSGKARAIEVTFDGLDIGKVDAIAAAVGFPLEGKLFGTVSLDLPEGKASKGNGNVNLEVRDTFAGNDKELTVKTPLGPFTLPRLKIGTFTVTGEAKDGNLKLSKIGASGGDVDVNGEGRVQLREVATDARLDVNLKFKINDTYRNKNEKTKMLFGAPGSKEKPMLEMDQRMAKAKSADGFYGLRVGGTLGKADVQPSASSVSAGLNNK